MVSCDVDKVLRELDATDPQNQSAYTYRWVLAHRRWQLKMLTGMSDAVLACTCSSPYPSSASEPAFGADYVLPRTTLVKLRYAPRCKAWMRFRLTSAGSE